MALYLDIFLQFLRLGTTSFGGPAAHLVFFERHFVTDKAWLSQEQYRQLVALCQFLPGPASSQVGIGIGLHRGGLTGAWLAFLGFTLPSFCLMTCAGLVGLYWLGPLVLQGALCALAAIVAHAIWQMSGSFLTDWRRRVLGMLALLIFLQVNQPVWHLLLLMLFALAGALLIRPATTSPIASWQNNARQSLPLLLAFTALMLALPISTALWPDVALLQLVQQHYQAGALVFGGGHVVLPLLEQSVGAQLSQTDFLAGYATAQLMPGPLFSFAAYLGAAHHGAIGALLATLALFLPGALLVCAIWPWWHRLSHYPALLGAVAAVNCAVVGLLASTWWLSVVRHAVATWWHGLLVVAGFVLLTRNTCKPLLLLVLSMLLVPLIALF